MRKIPVIKTSLLSFAILLLALNLQGQFVCYVDADFDTYGDPATMSNESQQCFMLGLVDNGLDCDDTNPAIHPCAFDPPNGIDENCDGVDGLPDIVLNTQSEVYALTYCGEVNNLTIESTDNAGDPIVDLFPLGQISAINGDLVIKNNEQMPATALFGLGQSAGMIGGSFIFENNDMVNDLSSIDIYGFIGGDLLVKGNDGMTTLYGGGTTLTTINGNMIIEDHPVMMDVTAFGLTSLGGDFASRNNPSSGSHPALFNLININGDLELSGTDAIGLSEAGNVTSLGGSLIIKDNPSFTSLAGLTSLTNIGGAVEITNNVVLSHCHTTAVCDHLVGGGAASISGNLMDCLDQAAVESACGITSCPGDLLFKTQTEVDAFSGCSIQDGNVSIMSDGTDPIIDLSNLSSLTEITGNLTISGCSQLGSLLGLHNVTKSKGVFIINNDLLSDLQGLNSLTHITNLNSLFIDGNDGLISLGGLDNLTNIEGSIVLKNLTQLQDVSGLDNLNLLGANLEIVDCDVLQEFNTLNNITTCSQIKVFNNDMLEIISGLSNLSTVTNNCEFIANPLTDIVGLTSLKSVGGSFGVSNTLLTDLNQLNSFTSSQTISFSDNINLSSITAFANVTTLVNFSFTNNPSLTSLSGLQGLINVINQASLSTNATLTDISALQNTQFGNSLIIVGNSMLDVCNIQSVCHHIAAGGTTNIINNSSNCIDVSTVQLQCEDAMPVIDGTSDACITIGTVDISAAAGNNNEWVQVSNGAGNILCAINANGNDLGLTEFKVFQSSNPRTAGLPYMNRDVTISPANQPTTDVSVRIYYTAAEFAALQTADPTIMSIADVDFTKTTTDCSGMFTGVGQFIPQTASGTYGSLGDVFVQGDVSSFSTFFANGQDQPLGVVVPIDLLSFSAKAKGKTVELSWTTSSEINSSHFEIQHAANPEDLTWISDVSANGFTEMEQQYRYTHKFPKGGNNYYRLKLIDMDGSYSYSETISIRMEVNEVTIYPNPSRDKIYINGTEQPVDYTVYDNLGRIMSRGIVQKDEPIDVSDLVNGLYQLVIKENGRIQNFSIVKI